MNKNWQTLERILNKDYKRCLAVINEAVREGKIQTQYNLVGEHLEERCSTLLDKLKALGYRVKTNGVEFVMIYWGGGSNGW